MAQDRRAAIFRIKEFVHKDVDRRAERVQRKVANVFRKREQRKGGTERQMRERRLEEWFSDSRPSKAVRRNTHVESDPRHKHDDC